MLLTDILRAIASSLQTPVIVILIVLTATMVVILGMFIAEVFTERVKFTVSLPKLVDALNAGGDAREVIRASGLLRRQKHALLELLKHPAISAAERESLAVNLVAAEQAHFDNRVKLTDVIAKVAPMLGLMGTLIPLGPGLVAIGQGDTETLSQSLLIAFDTTVLGLAVAAVALCVSAVRKTWYTRYMASFETCAECVLGVAEEQAAEWQEAGQQAAAAGAQPVAAPWEAAEDAPAGGQRVAGLQDAAARQTAAAGVQQEALRQAEARRAVAQPATGRHAAAEGAGVADGAHAGGQGGAA